MTMKQILVVDDDQDVCSMLGLYLRKEGFEVSFAGDGMTCLSKAQRSHPDLVILDLGLPAGDGLTTLERLRDLAHFAELPVLVLTGRDGEYWKDEALRSGASAYLNKPVSRQALLETVRQLLPCPADEPASHGALQCPHCGQGLQHTTVQLAPESIQAIVQALRAVPVA